MKKSTKSNLQTSLQTLGIIFLIFFAMAFACDDNDGNSQKDSPRTTNKQTKTTGGACSTEEEFKAMITDEKTYLAPNYQKRTVIFNSFEVEGPMYYENLYASYQTVTDDAYRVTTNFDVITRESDSAGTDKVYRERYEDVIIMFYPSGSQDECKKFYEKNKAAKEYREDVTGQY